MNKRIQKVIYHIETHLDDELKLTLLADISGYSRFHFCRSFKAQMGESVMSYASRLRFEAASIKVGRGDKSLINVALDAGFQTPTGFLKAFKKRFGTSPSNYKKISKQNINHYQETMMETPEIVSRETAFIVFTRATGIYFKSSDKAWQRLTKELDNLDKKHKESPPSSTILLDENKAELLGICYDAPQVTDEDKIRYDACIAWTEEETDFLTAEGFETKQISAGKYAKVLHKGSYETSDKSWYGLYAWIEKQGYEFRDEPSFEKYLNTPETVKEADLLTEIYVPVQ